MRQKRRGQGTRLKRQEEENGKRSKWSDMQKAETFNVVTKRTKFEGNGNNAIFEPAVTFLLVCGGKETKRTKVIDRGSLTRLSNHLKPHNPIIRRDQYLIPSKRMWRSLLVRSRLLIVHPMTVLQRRSPIVRTRRRDAIRIVRVIEDRLLRRIHIIRHLLAVVVCRVRC